MTTIKTTIQSHQRGLLYKDGKLVQWLGPGKHSFWSMWAEHRVDVIDLEEGYMKSTPELRAVLPEDAGYEVILAAHELGIITVDGVAKACVQPGRYILWQLRARVDVVVYDTRQLVQDLPDDHAALIPSHEVESYTILTHQRGVLYTDRQPARWLEPGTYRVFRRGWADHRIEVLELEQHYMKSTPELRAVLPEDAGHEVILAAHELGIITVDGVAKACVQPGRYILWQLRAKVDVVVYDTRQLLVELPDDHAAFMPAHEVESYAIATSQRGALYVDKKPARWLEPGTYRVFRRNRTLNLYYLDVNQGTYPIDQMPELVEIVPKGSAEPLEVADDEFALIYRDGRVIQCLQAGAYLLWNIRHRITAKVYSMAEIFSTVAEKEWAHVPTHLLSVKVVRPYEQGLLWVDGQFIGVFDEGRYGIHVKNRQVEFSVVDMREQELQIQGQEVMTRDKVTLRLNLVVKYRIEDALLSVQSSTALATALYSEAQLIARNHVASVSVDELLESRDATGASMLASLVERAREWGVELRRLDIKDLILPGEMKTLLNRVIEAEKQAAANVIMRREETAAMRAQANTAKMMENNPALLRMRELEMMREIATNVGNITVVAGGDQVVKWARGDS